MTHIFEESLNKVSFQNETVTVIVNLLKKKINLFDISPRKHPCMKTQIM